MPRISSKLYNRAKSRMLDWKNRYANEEFDFEKIDPGPTPFGPSNLVFPAHLTKLNFYSSFRNDIRKYFCDNEIAYHDLVGHILSSQAFCLNLFGKALTQKDFVLPILRMLPHNSNVEDISVNYVDFEWNDYDIVYHDFGEKTGRRGEKQTSCDVAIGYTSHNVRCLLLIEFKFTEGTKSQQASLGHCFTSKKTGEYRECQNRRALWTNPYDCPLEQSRRKPKDRRKPQHYWAILKTNDGGPFKSSLFTLDEACPFQYEGYQLMRSQLLGWLYERRDGVRCDFMLLYDGRNEVLRQDRPIHIGGQTLGFDDWAGFIKNDRFYYGTVQEIWNQLHPDNDHRKYIEGRYLDWE
jgi:hypothetical protein